MTEEQKKRLQDEACSGVLEAGEEHTSSPGLSASLLVAGWGEAAAPAPSLKPSFSLSNKQGLTLLFSLLLLSMLPLPPDYPYFPSSQAHYKAEQFS